MIDVNRPTATKLGTVLVPFQDPRGPKFVVEISLSQWRAMRGDIDEQFQQVAHQAEIGAAILSIDRHESVVG
jgi:hypothetical protein